MGTKSIKNKKRKHDKRLSQVKTKQPSPPQIKPEIPKPNPTGRLKMVVLFSILLGIISFTVYYNSLSGDFVWDDRALILQDKMIKDMGNIPKAFNRDFFDFTDDEVFKYGYFRPLITMSYMIDYAIWGENPFGYHLVNLAVHTVCSIFVFWIFLGLGLPQRSSFLGGAIFAVHPIHTESVSWISGRTDLFCCLFLLIAFGCYIAYRRGQTSFSLLKNRDISPNRLYGISLFSYALCLLSKEMGVVLIFMIVVVEWLYFRKQEKTFNLKNKVKSFVPYLALTMGYLYWHSSVVNRLSGNVLKVDFSRIYPNIVTFFKGFVFYLYKLLLPIDLSAYLKVEMLNSFTQPVALMYFFAVVIFFYFLSVGYEKKPLLGLGGGLLLATMIPLSNIVNITGTKDMGYIMAERFMYIPSIGFVLILVIGLDWANEVAVRKYKSMERLGTAAVVIFIVALGYRTVVRNRDWKNDETLFVSEADTDAKSGLVHNNLGMFYARKGQFEKAVYHLKQVLQMAPDSPALLNNLGRTLVDMGNPGEAVIYLKKAISLNPLRFQFYNNLGLAEVGLKHYDKALEAYSIALKLHPSAAQTYNNMGVAYKNIGDIQKAQYSYLKAIEYDQTYEAPHKNLAILYLTYFKKPDLAVKYLRKSLEIDPNQLDAPRMREIIKSFESQ